MKQHITPKQANEITEEQFYSLFPAGFVKRDDWANYHHKKITIGKMIEILEIKGWTLLIKWSEWDGKYRVSNNQTNGRAFHRKELCDALWQALSSELS